MAFNNLLKDKVSLIKHTGEVVDTIAASVQKNKIFISRSDILIESNDVIHRKMSNGGEEYYLVVNPNFHEKLGSIPAGYQMDVTKTDNPNNTEKVATIAEKGSVKNNRVFIVHGHDELSKVNVARFLEKAGLEPIILHEQASLSKTIIEKIEAYSDVGFAVVIYSPCDLGGKASTDPLFKPRARQNVVFEHGYFIGHLGRSNVCALVKGEELETPNDISGVVYTPLDDRGAWKMDLAKELKEADYSVDLVNAI